MKSDLTGALVALRRGALAMVLCLVGALLFDWASLPLPWMLGPMLAMALACLRGLPVERPHASLPLGQLVLGIALGLYFTPPVLGILLHYAPYIFAAGIFAFLLGAGTGWVVGRLSGCDLKTAFFASLPGGAAEMSVLAERCGARPDWVAAAHGLRVIMVVSIVPPLITASGAHGSDLWVAGVQTVQVGGLAWLIFAGCIAGLLMRYFKMPNAWILGPLLMTVILTGMGISLSAVPRWMVNVAQLLIGCSLGSRFTADFFRAAPRFLAWSAAGVCASIALAAVFAYGLALVSGISLPTAVLATAPGGIAEMSVTAKVLQLGVPVVTAFHVTRMALILLSAPPAFALLRRYRRSRAR